MAFFKVNRTLSEIEDLEARSAPELRYVIDENGKGYWVKPKPPMTIDYDEDIPC